MDGFVFLGRLVKPHGILGDLKLYASDDFWSDVLESKELWLQVERGDDVAPAPAVGVPLRGDDVERRPVRIEQVRAHQGQYLLKFEGIDDRSQAEAEVGADLFVDMTRLDVALPDHELPFQVIGSAVRTEDGRALGTVTNVLSSPGQSIYEVTGEQGRVLIPAVPAFIVGRDDDDQLVVRPIPGLLPDADG